MRNKPESLEEELFRIGLVLIAVLGILSVIYLLADRAGFVIPCPLYHYLGFYCPGCGGTRAVRELLHGHLLRSLWYHPLVPYGAIVGMAFMGSHLLRHLGVPVKGMKYRNIYLWAALGILVVNWIGKNLLLHLFGITL